MSASKIYFASDFHLGAPNQHDSMLRERRIVRWLEYIEQDAAALYLLGDVFDFWFEYRSVVPKGYVRLLGKLAELADGGLPITYFVGNHDLWMQTYFEQELGIATHRAPLRCTLHGKHFLLGHGDGLGPHDTNYKRLKKIFTNPICRSLFSWVHPDIGTALAMSWSRRSRHTNDIQPDEFKTKEQEWLYAYAVRKHAQQPFDFAIFGHRHLPIDCHLPNNTTRYINLGAWFASNSYAVFDGNNVQLQFFENADPTKNIIYS